MGDPSEPSFDDVAAYVRDGIKYHYRRVELETIMKILETVNRDAERTGRRFALAIDLKEIQGDLVRTAPIALFVPAFGGPSGDVDMGAQFFRLPGDLADPNTT